MTFVNVFSLCGAFIGSRLVRVSSGRSVEALADLMHGVGRYDGGEVHQTFERGGGVVSILRDGALEFMRRAVMR